MEGLTLKQSEQKAMGVQRDSNSVQGQKDKFFHYKNYLINLLSAQWMPSRRGSMQILLTFKQSLECFFFKMKSCLSVFSIFPVLVFCREIDILLLDQFSKVGIITLKSKCNHLNPDNLASLAMTFRKKNSNLQTVLPTAGESAWNSLEVKLIESFGALPDLEQADTTQRLDELRETFVTIHSTAKPLINLALPGTQDCGNKLNQQVANDTTTTK